MYFLITIYLFIYLSIWYFSVLLNIYIIIKKKKIFFKLYIHIYIYTIYIKMSSILMNIKYIYLQNF